MNKNYTMVMLVGIWSQSVLSKTNSIMTPWSINKHLAQKRLNCQDYQKACFHRNSKALEPLSVILGAAVSQDSLLLSITSMLPRSHAAINQL